MRLSHSALALAFTVASTLGGSAVAQPAAPAPGSAYTGSISIIQARPQGDFARGTGTGYGLAGALLLPVDHAGILSIRADAGALSYGNESKRTALSTTIGGRVQVDVSTTNYLVPLSIGPQITWPTGPVRPYVTAGLGAQFFFTESTAEGTSPSAPIASSTNQSDIATAWQAGGGMYLRLSEGRVPVMLDLGVQYIDGGRARYLAPGSIVDLPNGAIRVTPMETTTQMTVVRIGARIGR